MIIHQSINQKQRAISIESNRICFSFVTQQLSDFLLFFFSRLILYTTLSDISAFFKKQTTTNIL